MLDRDFILFEGGAALKRSIEYYRSKAGKEKKKQLNARHADQNRLVESTQDEMHLSICQCGIDKITLSHIRVVTALIEARDVGGDEIVRMVAEILRQLSIDKRKKGVILAAISLKTHRKGQTGWSK